MKKYLLISLLLAAIAGLEFGHALYHDHAPDGNFCIPTESKAAAVRDMLFAHFRNH